MPASVAASGSVSWRMSLPKYASAASPKPTQTAGALDNAGQCGGLRQRELADVFAEIRFGRLAKAVDPETAAAAQIDLVGVVFKDLLLGKGLLQAQRNEEFRHLARPALLGLQPKVFRQLLAQRGRALLLAPLFQVHVHRLDDAQRVEALVLEEALVLGRSDGVDEHFRNIGELYQTSFLALAIEEIGDEVRLDLVLGASRVVAQGDDLRDAAVGELDQAGLFVEIRIRTGENLDGPIRPHLERPDGVAARFGIAAAAQLGGDLVCRGEVAGRY